MGKYEARRVDLKTLAAAAAMYDKIKLSDALNDEACGPGGNGPGLLAGQVVTRLREVGLPALMCASDPDAPPYQVAEATENGRLFLARMRGYGGQEDPFWGIAWVTPIGDVAVIMHMPEDVDLSKPAPFSEAWTGLGVMITRRLPDGQQYYANPSPN